MARTFSVIGPVSGLFALAVKPPAQQIKRVFSTPWTLSLLVGMTGIITTFGSASATTLGDIGETALQTATGDAVQTVCGSFIANQATDNLSTNQATLFDKCGEMVQTANAIADNAGNKAKDLGITADQLRSALQNVATEEAATVGTMATETLSGQVVNVSNRIAALITGARGIKVSGLNDQHIYASRSMTYAPSGGGAGDALVDNRLGLFVNGGLGMGEKNDTDAEDAFDYDSAELTFGVDYQVTPQSVFGVALGYASLEADFDKTANVSGGNVDADGINLSAYGLYYRGNGYINWILGYGRNSFDLERTIVIESGDERPVDNDANDGVPGAVATADTDSDQVNISLGGGYEFKRSGLSMIPFGRLDYMNVDVDGYTEAGAGALNLKVDAQEIESLATAIGVQLSSAISKNFGVIIPQARLEWIHQFEDESRDITARYIHDPRNTETGHQLIATTDDPDENYFSLSLGLSGVLSGGKQLFIEYASLLGLEDIEEHVIRGGFRLAL